MKRLFTSDIINEIVSFCQLFDVDSSCTNVDDQKSGYTYIYVTVNNVIHYRFIITSTDNGLSTYDKSVFDIIIFEDLNKAHNICVAENMLTTYKFN